MEYGSTLPQIMASTRHRICLLVGPAREEKALHIWSTASGGIGPARFAGEKGLALGMQGHRQSQPVTIQSVVDPSRATSRPMTNQS